MRQTAAEFTVDGEAVQGVFASPTDSRPPYPAAVVCHAHPLFGGHMDSPVIFAICRELAERGIASLRFNFRPFKEGATEADGSAVSDVARALEVLGAWRDSRSSRLGVVGYSAGAAAVARGIEHLGAARAFVLISPPLSAVRSSSIGGDSRPRLLLAGTADRIVDAAELQAAASEMQAAAQFDSLPGADHTLRGHELAAAQRTVAFLEQFLRR